MRRLALLLAIGLLCGPIRAIAEEAEWVIPSGHEAEVQAFLQPLALGKPAGAGFLLDAIQIDRDHIELAFRRENETDRVVVRLLHPAAAPGDLAAGAVRLRADDGVPDALLASVQSALATGEHPPLPWIHTEEALDGETEATLTLWQQAKKGPVRGLLWALLAVLAGATAWTLRKAWKSTPPPTWAVAGLALVTVGGVALRLAFSPRTFLHEYYHVADHLHGYLFRNDQHYLYGETGPALYRLANALLGGDEEAVFSANLVCASLSIPAIALFDFALSRSWIRALAAGALLAVLPMHLRFSASEDLSMPATLFALWSLAAWIRYLDTRSVSALIAAICALALTMQTRPELLVFPLVLALFVLATRPPREWKLLLDRRTLLGVLALELLVLPRLLQLLGGEGHEPRESPATEVLRRIAFFDSSVVPPALWLLLLIGLAQGVRTARGRTLWLASGATLFTALSLAFFTNPPPYNLRTQMVALPFFLVLCTEAIPALAGALQVRAGLVAGLAGALAIAGGVSRLDDVIALGDQQQEWAFLRDTVPELPIERGQLLTVAVQNVRSIDTFPRFLLRRASKGLMLVDLGHAQESGRWPEAMGGLLFYQGMYCHFARESEPAPSPLTERCLEVRRRYRLKPVATRLLAGPGYSRLSYAPAPFLVGFFELLPRGEGAPKAEGP